MHIIFNFSDKRPVLQRHNVSLGRRIYYLFIYQVLRYATLQIW